MKEHSCENCKHIDKGIESPECTGCIHNALDKWQPMTNGDRIRRMSDEELAESLKSIGIMNGHFLRIQGKEVSVEWVEKWLKKEVE